MWQSRSYAVYILASRRNGTLYTGISGDLLYRIHQHRTGAGSKFAAKHGVTRLVYYEQTSDAYAAIVREKQIKKWLRAWKVALIEEHNPEWRDLYVDGKILPLPKP